jgi:hypothetical protein
MKKQIKSFNDIIYIINNKCDVIDINNHVIPFVRFVNFSLVDIIEIINGDVIFYYKTKIDYEISFNSYC